MFLPYSGENETRELLSITRKTFLCTSVIKTASLFSLFFLSLTHTHTHTHNSIYFARKVMIKLTLKCLNSSLDKLSKYQASVNESITSPCQRDPIANVFTIYRWKFLSFFRSVSFRCVLLLFDRDRMKYKAKRNHETRDLREGKLDEIREYPFEHRGNILDRIRDRNREFETSLNGNGEIDNFI